jgi:hypothetical protein
VIRAIFAVGWLVAAIAPLASAAPAMPFWSGRSFDRPVIPAADKCGIGRYRDASGVCRRKYQLGRAAKPFYGSCGGVNAHRVCNFIGQCWMVCD